MPVFKFQDLVDRHSEMTAWGCLFEIEKAAGIHAPRHAAGDPETRLAYALHVQDAMLAQHQAA